MKLLSLLPLSLFLDKMYLYKIKSETQKHWGISGAVLDLNLDCLPFLGFVSLFNTRQNEDDCLP